MQKTYQKKIQINELLGSHAEKLGLHLLAGKQGVGRTVQTPEVQQPGLSLAGFLQGHIKKRLLIFDKVEIGYLKKLASKQRFLRLNAIISNKTPAIIICGSLAPLNEMMQLCEQNHLPLLRTHLSALSLMSQLNALFVEALAPQTTCHGSLVEVFGIGLLIQGEAAVGKSEAALGLIKRGHRLIADDIVKIKKKEGEFLEGSGVDISRHPMEIKGIGIINIAGLYGIAGVLEKKKLDIVVKLEVWNDSHFYERGPFNEQNISLLGMELPYYLLLAKPGRDIVLLLETIALNHRLKNLSTLECKGARTWEKNS